jgi:hypothetical protein
MPAGYNNFHMSNQIKLIPIYTTSGDLGAFMAYPYIYNVMGEWIGFITAEKEVYSVLGHFVGDLADGPRILRKRTYSFDKPRLEPPPHPKRIVAPATVPLAPMMAEVPFSLIDVLEDEPERLSTVDAGELREDMD